MFVCGCVGGFVGGLVCGSGIGFVCFRASDCDACTFSKVNTLLPHQADLNRDRARVNGDQKSSAGNHAKLSSEINAVLINYTKGR